MNKDIYFINEDRSLIRQKDLDYIGLDEDMFYNICKRYDVLYIRNIYCKEIPKQAQIYLKLKGMAVHINNDNMLCIGDLTLKAYCFYKNIEYKDLIYIYDNITKKKEYSDYVDLYGIEEKVQELIEYINEKYKVCFQYYSYDIINR